MERVLTRDGSPTLRSDVWDCAYHSLHGAWTEAKHVYIQSGLHAQSLCQPQNPLTILEMGAGTGLNALLAVKWAHAAERPVSYYGLDAALPEASAWESWWSARPESAKDLDPWARAMRNAWEEGKAWQTPWSTTSWIQGEAASWRSPLRADVVFYDAFSPRQQPELWTAEALEPWLEALTPEGFFVTYCATGEVFRAVKSLGFAVEHLPGPPGKREMLRAHRKGTTFTP
ncbi:MAG: tRNA (5-methylaminomethyl-2-thiouridine)(34)-methyltransferase MnmD [Schleiferiaceae bacterium]